MTLVLPDEALADLLSDLVREDPGEWREFASCLGRNPDLFFPERGGKVTHRQAKQVCRGCLVREECLEFALETDQRFGVWGGLSESERRNIQKQAAG